MVAIAFNEAINARDIGRLEELMTWDHVFIDTVGTGVVGKPAALRAWEGFFESFPDYRNVWTDVIPSIEGVIAVGRSECTSEPELDGPAIWTAKVREGRVATWRVHEDTTELRADLGIADSR